jgi:DNA-binding MarR family transcriptional regulator
VTLGQLAAAEQVKPPTMTRLVTGLESEGLVRREADGDDARLTFIHPTAKGRKILLAGRARRVRLLESAISRLSDTKIAQLETATQLLGEVIGDMRTRNHTDRSAE